MSLVETTLGKLRQGGKRRDDTPAPHRPSLRGTVSRTVADPKLRFTPAMLERLGITKGHDPDRQRAAEYRHIKQQLLVDLNPERRIIVVASALAGEGKSFTSANLARALAREPDYTVLLVDADALRPQLTRAMELVNKPGLINALADEAVDVESLILTTDIEGLSVLPAGSSSDISTEFFGSERMRDVLLSLQRVPNRIILIDSLPLLLTTESRALLPLASQVLLVVRAESTPQSAVQKALDLVGEGVNAKMVLNAVARTKLSRVVGYEYGYDYDYHDAGTK